MGELSIEVINLLSEEIKEREDEIEKLDNLIKEQRDIYIEDLTNTEFLRKIGEYNSKKKELQAEIDLINEYFSFTKSSTNKNSDILNKKIFDIFKLAIKKRRERLIEVEKKLKDYFKEFKLADKESFKYIVFGKEIKRLMSEQKEIKETLEIIDDFLRNSFKKDYSIDDLRKQKEYLKEKQKKIEEKYSKRRLKFKGNVNILKIETSEKTGEYNIYFSLFKNGIIKKYVKHYNLSQSLLDNNKSIGERANLFAKYKNSIVYDIDLNLHKVLVLFDNQFFTNYSKKLCTGEFNIDTIYYLKKFKKNRNLKNIVKRQNKIYSNARIYKSKQKKIATIAIAASLAIALCIPLRGKLNSFTEKIIGRRRIEKSLERKEEKNFFERVTEAEITEEQITEEERKNLTEEALASKTTEKILKGQNVTNVVKGVVSEMDEMLNVEGSLLTGEVDIELTADDVNNAENKFIDIDSSSVVKKAGSYYVPTDDIEKINSEEMHLEAFGYKIGSSFNLSDDTPVKTKWENDDKVYSSNIGFKHCTISQIIVSRVDSQGTHIEDIITVDSENKDVRTTNLYKEYGSDIKIEFCCMNDDENKFVYVDLDDIAPVPIELKRQLAGELPLEELKVFKENQKKLQLQYEEMRRAQANIEKVRKAMENAKKSLG